MNNVDNWNCPIDLVHNNKLVKKIKERKMIWFLFGIMILAWFCMKEED